MLSNTFSRSGIRRFSSSTYSKATAKTALLQLEDGTEYVGRSFGAAASTSGELVFTTGMVGYPESMTDPSYHGQILTMTFPTIGNYGVPPYTKDNLGLMEHFESKKIQTSGLVVSDYSQDYSHWRATRSLHDWMDSEGIPGIFGVDTRSIAKRLRTHGTMAGRIVVPEGLNEVHTEGFYNPGSQNVLGKVSDKKVSYYGEGDLEVLAVDCGMKHSIIRELVKRGARVKVVPWDHDISKEKFDALFLSNGPGDPMMAQKTISELAAILKRKDTKPIFGICLGHQLLSLAAGAKTVKLPFGNRGHNQPCIDVTNNRCYITSQNHGYAVDVSTLPEGWKPYFYNANDNSNEGVRHQTLPYFTVQFHPEARSGPTDTTFLFDQFMDAARQAKPSLSTSSTNSIGSALARGEGVGSMLKFKSSSMMERPGKVLILGSGGLSIGQAGEFDYSGSQAIKALKEEGISSVLINPNIATVQTSEGSADQLYFLPVEPKFVERVIEQERPDAILLQFGGQTALNCGVKLYETGVLQKYNVRVLGTPVDTIIATEDRDKFAKKITEINEPIAKSVAVTTTKDAVVAAESIGYPVIVRAAYALGGLGSGFCNNETELKALLQKSFSSSPQVLVERSMKGWKEVEYEVVRDAYDNCVAVCNMENFDPLGIHTGDSVVVAPSQTLDDRDYHRLRRASIDVVRHLGVVGECNVQFAQCPKSDNYCIIEVNPRLSRSSALASKATGYPLAFVAAKLALGHALPDLRNSVTGITTACFEPSLDYLVTKFPKWDLGKFARVSTQLGSSMKSVGEVMSIGRNFEESFQKAVRMASGKEDGFAVHGIAKMDTEEIRSKLRTPCPQRVSVIAAAFRNGWTVADIHAETAIDTWFLEKLQNIVSIESKLVDKFSDASKSQRVEMLKDAKKAGLSDERLGELLQLSENEIRTMRLEFSIEPALKQIDTLAAEFPAKTNYLYFSYHGTEDDDVHDDNPVVEGKLHGALVLGGGAYRIGSSVEFDYSCVQCVRTLRNRDISTVVLNHNPETVSTDYDESDRLYFDELSTERVLDVLDKEKQVVNGVVVSFGGQVPNNLVMPLAKRGVKILGTDPDCIDNAENRERFSEMLDANGISQPRWRKMTTLKDIEAFAEDVGYPLLVRPSYVLSGAAMAVVRSSSELKSLLAAAVAVSQEHPVVVSEFMLGAREIEFDGVSQNGQLLVHAVSEHVENAGVHSGDATLVLPAQNLSDDLQKRIVDTAAKMAHALKISGPLNAQFIVDRNDNIFVIECNVRASRSFPFVSKTLGVDFVNMATRVLAGEKVDPIDIDVKQLNHVGVKCAQFSFQRLAGADPVLGVEMASTGEVACFGDNLHDAFLKALMARNFSFPSKAILLSTGSSGDKQHLLPTVRKLVDMGFKLYATEGTSNFLESNGVHTEACHFPSDENPQLPGADELLGQGLVDLVINIPKSGDSHELENAYLVRRAAIDRGVPLLTDPNLALTFVDAIESLEKVTTQPFSATKPVDHILPRKSSSPIEATV